MRIDPKLQALRGNPAAQRLAQTSLENARDAWCAEPLVEGVLERLADYGGGRALDDCPELVALFREDGEGRRFVAPLVAKLIPALREHPLGHIPFRHQHNAGLSLLLLAQAGGATISLLTYAEGGTSSVPDSICFSDGERHELVLAGSADLRLFSIRKDRGASADISSEIRSVEAGAVLTFEGATQTKTVERAHGRLVVLRLARAPKAPLPSREFRLCDGQLVHRASGDRRESRQEMMMALLGRMGRSDAAPVLADMTGEGSDNLRWQALRECLALDTAQGFTALCRLSADSGDSLGATAEALRVQLLQAHPQLAALESELCLA